VQLSLGLRVGPLKVLGTLLVFEFREQNLSVQGLLPGSWPWHLVAFAIMTAQPFLPSWQELFDIQSSP
jgi:hypothetical protein